MAGFLLEIGKSIITQCLLPDIKIHFDYWWCFDNNIQGLKDGIHDLEGQIYDINQEIEAARLRTDILRPGVEEWPKTGTKKLVEAITILQDDINPKAWNLISRYSMGKRAKKAAEEIAKHINDGNFNAMSDPAPPRVMGSTSHISTMDFHSRKSIEEEIIKCLKESSVGMIGICGMGGVGKTTMAQRIRERVMEEKLFDEAMMITVSKQRDILELQEEIAEWLNLESDEKHMSTRADKLRMRLMDKKRKIIIFDDVREGLKFEDLGIPFEIDFERCKVLSTSRSTDIFKGIKNKKVFELKILTDEEAWMFFKEKAGECVEDSTLHSVAKDFVAECKGLPIALVTVATALQNLEKSFWVDSLSQLRRSNPVDFPEFLVNVYRPLKLSYDYLASETQKDLFLLCCLFPEDYDIPVEELTLYFMGLRKFDRITCIEEARMRMHRLLDILKSRFLLIDGQKKLHVKMHDVVRDMAIYIGLKEKNGFLKSLNKTSIESSSDVECNWMSVDISNEGIEIPVAMRFPKLRLLMLLKSSYEEFSDISFEGMEDLNVLSFSSTRIGSLPPTLQLLQSLRTLCLFYCKVENISVIGELVSLEVFCCNGCNKIEELPAEIGRLYCLRLLELNECRKLRRIPFGILSSLVQLEELKMLGSFDGWKADENGKEMGNASLTELECLPKLTCLEIEISDSNLAAQEICLSTKLVKYKIYIASEDDWFKERDYEKVMNLNLPSDIGAVGNWIRLLVRNSESLFLKGDGSNNINLEECQDLRNLGFGECSMVKKLVKTKDCKSGIVFPLLEALHLYELENLEEIRDGTILLNHNVSLCNLKSVDITACSNLRTLFSVSMAGSSLLQLEVLEIQWCHKMEQVFWTDITDDTDASIEFQKLKKLRLDDLPKLTAFCQGVQTIKFPNLTDLKITSCFSLGTLFSVSMARSSLLQLEVLEIGGCHKMERVFWNDIGDATDASIVFPKLKILTLYDLPNLTAFCQGVQTIKFPELTQMEIGYLPKLNSLCPLNSETAHDDTTSFHFLCNQKVEIGGLEILSVRGFNNNFGNIWCHEISMNFFNNIQKLRIFELNGMTSLMPYSIAKNLVSLKELFIWICQRMVEVIEGNDDDKEVLVDIKCLFPTLQKLEIGYLPKLRRFWQWNNTLKLPLLEEVMIIDCPMMETFTMGSLNTPNLKMINWQAIDDTKDLNDFITSELSQNIHTTEEEEEDQDENKIKYNNEKEEDEGERK